jgi:hypothetical protein
VAIARPLTPGSNSKKGATTVDQVMGVFTKKTLKPGI